jgi:hypothetical protein
MHRFLSSPAHCAVTGTILVFGILFSEVGPLWLASTGAFVLSVFALGWHKARPILVWIIAFNMLQIWADVLLFELHERGLSVTAPEHLQEEAIYYSSCAILFVAIGIRLGLLTGNTMLKWNRPAGGPAIASLKYSSAPRIAALYFCFVPVALMIVKGAGFLPGLTQAILALILLKFILIYWLSSTVFAQGRHYLWLVFVLATEVAIGSTGFFSSFKEAFFVAAIALASSRRPLGARQVAFGVAGFALILYMSLVWTAVKNEYRSFVAGEDAATSITWLASKYLGGDVDFSEAADKLLERVGYTRFYALVLATQTESIQGIYQGALEHIFKPRLFFPDKSELNDSAQTQAVLDWDIDAQTSVGLGYVAQAHIDFSFPGLLGPMVLLGVLVGLIYSYFITRSGSEILREAFAVGCLFNALAFAGNIDKQLGGVLTAFIVLAAVHRLAGAKIYALGATSIKSIETNLPELIR